ncbi:MAG: glycosyltransferase [Gemmataceae bacterium]
MTGTRPIRVSFLIDSLSYAGTEMQLLALIQSLDRSRVQPSLVLLNGTLAESQSLEPRDCPILRLGLTSFRNLPATARAVTRLARFWKRQHVDVVQTYFLDSTYFGVPIARALGIRRVVRVRNNLGHWLTPTHRGLGRFIGRIVDATITNSQAGHDALRAAEGLAAEKLVLLENGVDVDRFAKLDPPRRDNGVTIGVMANLRPVKGVDVFIRAAKQLILGNSGQHISDTITLPLPSGFLYPPSDPHAPFCFLPRLFGPLPPCGGGLGWGVEPSRASTPHPITPPPGGRGPEGCGRGLVSFGSLQGNSDRETEVKFLIAGDGEQRAELERLVDQLDLSDHVTFLGRIRNVTSFLTQIDIGVVPSHAEGMSNALLEFMASGRPVVATDVGANAELLGHGSRGLLVPPGDEIALATAINQLIVDEPLAARLAASARDYVQTYFDRGEMCRRFEEFYERLCA